MSSFATDLITVNPLPGRACGYDHTRLAGTCLSRSSEPKLFGSRGRNAFGSVEVARAFLTLSYPTREATFSAVIVPSAPGHLFKILGSHQSGPSEYATPLIVSAVSRCHPTALQWPHTEHVCPISMPTMMSGRRDAGGVESMAMQKSVALNE